MDHLKTLFKVDPEKNALTKWQSEVILAIHEFLSQVNQRVIQDHNLNLSSLMISYISEADNVTNIEDAAQILEHCLTGVGISVSLAPLSTAEALKAQLKQHNVLIVLCTPAYAQRVGEEPLIRELIDEFGKTKNDSLHTLLCVGGFGDTALKVVDGHYLIRSYHGALRGGTSLTSLQTFIDVILSVSGNQGLGLLPDLLDLEKMGRAKARNQYGVLLNDLFNTLQEITSHYRLSQDLEFKIAQNHLKEYFNPDKSLTSSLSTFLNQNTAKTFLFLCSSKADTILTGLRIEQTLLEQGDLALSIDCHDYTAKSAQQSVLLALQHLHFKRLEIDALKQNPIVIIFKNYEQLGAYDNLYVKNQLRQWSKAKILVTCHAEHFQHRDYQSCFLCDPANPQMSSFSVLRVPHFAPPAAEAQTQVLKVKQDMDTAEQESFLHPKTLAIQSEVTNFLENLNQTLIEAGTLKPILAENPQAFISYAWEAEKESLQRQQKHLSRIARDLSTFGIPTWLDIERMTGDIDEQMAGNIKDSTYALVIGTPRYTQRAEQPTNVRKEYQAIVAKEKQGTLKVFPMKFANENPFPAEFMSHPNVLDFRQIDDESIYIKQLTTLLPQLISLDPFKYQEHLNVLQNALQLLPASYLITEKNQDEIQSYDIDNRLKAYVKPHALSRLDDPFNTRYDLPKNFNEFLTTNVKTYVTLGRAGSGKSLFTLFTFKRLLQEWHQWRASGGSRPEWLPIYIALKSYANAKAEQAIELSLKSYHLDTEDIENLKQGLGVGQKVLFIFDGYDELGKGVRPNYVEQLRDWHLAKLLVSGRPEHFDNDAQHRDSFALNRDPSSFKVIYVSPFSLDEIKDYIATYDSDPETYTKIESMPGLMPLLENPFLLNLVLQALPRLLEAQKMSRQLIKRSDIYQAFIETLFNKEAYKQEEIHGRTIELACYHQLAQDLAFALFREKTISLTPDKTALWELFSSSDAHIREACPLKRTGEEYSFLHKSVYEFLVAVRLWKVLKENNETLVEHWNVRPLSEESAVIDFLVEFYQTNRSFYDQRLTNQQSNRPRAKEQLFRLIENSKQQTSLAQAAANAITTLNSMNLTFWRKNFTNIRIPGADLRYSACDYSDFSGADLRNVLFQASSLIGVNFTNAQMEGVKFGELPSLSFKNDIYDFSSTRDGRQLAVATGDMGGKNTIQIYNVRTQTLCHSLSCEGYRSCEVVFNPKGDVLAYVDDYKKIRLWKVELGELYKTLEGHNNTIKSLAFNSSGTVLASGDKIIRLWNVESGEIQTTFEGHRENVLSLEFSPNGKQLASGSYDNTIRLWDVETGSLQRVLEGHTEIVTEVHYSPKGDQLASGSNDRTIKLWNVGTGELQKTLEGHTDYVCCVAYSPNGDQLASGSNDTTICVWGVERGELRKTLKGHSSGVHAIVFSPEGDRLTSGSYDKTVRFWDIDQGELQKTLKGHTSIVDSLAFSPNGALLVSGGCCLENTVRLWNVETGELQKTFQGNNFVNCGNFSPNSELLAFADDCKIHLWNVGTGELQNTFEGHTARVNCLAFSPKGELLVSGSNDKTIKVWNVVTGDLHKTLEGHNAKVKSVIFNPKGELVSSGDDEFIRIWDVGLGEQRKSIESNLGVGCISLSPNGEHLTSWTGSWDCMIRLWSLEGGEQKTLGNHAAQVTCGQFTSNGEWFVSGGYDKAIRLWNYDEQLSVLNTFSAIYCLSTKPSSQLEDDVYFATGHEDNSIRYWRIDVQHQNNKPSFELVWNSVKSSRLNTENVIIEETQGLSLFNAKLLEQGGAKGQPNMLLSLLSGAEEGHVNSQAEIGKLYLEGKKLPQDYQKAFHFLSQAQMLERKHPIAAFYLAQCYQKGTGVTPDPNKAFELYQLAIEGGSSEAEGYLGNCYRKGEGVPKDMDLGLKWLQKGVEKNGAEAQFGMGECLRLGEGVSQDLRKSFQYYSLAAAQEHTLALLALQIIPQEIPKAQREAYFLANYGETEAQLEIGQLYLEGKEISQNLQSAFYFLARAAKKNNGTAQYLLGRTLLNGEGLEKNSEIAIHFLTLSAKGGNTEAKAILGNFYQVTKCVGKDLSKGFRWLKEAAEENNAEAQFNLGECFKHGRGVKQSFREAFQYYSKASKQGHSLAIQELQMIPSDFPPSKAEIFYLALNDDSEAQTNLGLCYYHGFQEYQNGSYETLDQNFNKAVEWFSKAATGGANSRAQNLLGESFEKGQGISQNLDKAREWFEKAAAQGSLEAHANLDRLNDDKKGVEEEQMRLALEPFLETLAGEIRG